MAKYDSGLLSGFTGKLGNVVVYRRNGKNFIRSVPKKRRDNPTDTQLEQRAKFALMSAFIRLMSPVLDKTYNGEKFARRNRAFAYNYGNAISGSYPDLSIDFFKVLLANGNLEFPHQAQIMPHSAAKVKFTWTNEYFTWGSCEDKAVLICYCPELRKVHWAVGPAMRKDRNAVLDLPAFRGKQIHAWMTFISRSDVANSAYCGSIVVPGRKPRRVVSVP
jgi:hypothetical protein